MHQENKQKTLGNIKIDFSSCCKISFSFPMPKLSFFLRHSQLLKFCGKSFWLPGKSSVQLPCIQVLCFLKQCKIIFSRLVKFLYTVLMHLWHKQFSYCVILTSFIWIQHVFSLTTFYWIFSYKIKFYINTQPIYNKCDMHIQVNSPSWSLDNSHKNVPSSVL